MGTGTTKTLEALKKESTSKAITQNSNKLSVKYSKPGPLKVEWKIKHEDFDLSAPVTGYKKEWEQTIAGFKGTGSINKDADGSARFSIQLSVNREYDGKSYPLTIAKLEATTDTADKVQKEMFDFFLDPISSSSAGNQLEFRCKLSLDSDPEIKKWSSTQFKFVVKPIVGGGHSPEVLAAATDMQLEVTVNMKPCGLQLLKPDPETLGQASGWKSESIVRTRVVRAYHLTILDPAQHVGVSGPGVASDWNNRHSHIWLELLFQAPTTRLWLINTPHMQCRDCWKADGTLKDNTLSSPLKVDVVQWEGGRFAQNGKVRLTQRAFTTSDEVLEFQKHIRLNPDTAFTPGLSRADLIALKKGANHIVQPTGIDSSNGFLRFGTTTGDGFKYEHIRTFNCDYGQSPDDIWYDLRGDGANVNFSLWYGVTYWGADWKKQGGDVHVKIFVPEPDQVKKVNKTCENWFKHNTLRDHWLKYDDRNKELHEFYPDNPPESFSRTPWSSHNVYFCHDYGWRMPGDRTRVDLAGHQDKFLAGIDSDPSAYGFEKCEYNAEVGDIVFFKGGAMAVDKTRINHSGVVHSDSLGWGVQFISKNVWNGIFLSTNADGDFFTYNFGKLYYYRRVKCWKCGEEVTSKDKWCSKCGPAKPGESGVPDTKIPGH